MPTYLQQLQGRIQAQRARNVTTSCAICGRELTDPRSATNGIGPICRDKPEAASLVAEIDRNAEAEESE